MRMYSIHFYSMQGIDQKTVACSLVSPRRLPRVLRPLPLQWAEWALAGDC